jgi:S-ribosylhomocysteine lyase
MTKAANDFSHLGWEPGSTGELDHRLVKAPYIRLSSGQHGTCGDTIYVFDLRITQPNTSYMSTLQIHSLEHLFLAGFRKHLPTAFVSVAPMGCQTGFYLILLNEGRARVVCEAYKKIFTEILSMDAIPYANEKDRGQFIHHNIKHAKKIAKMLLRAESKWLNVFGTTA